MNYATSFSVKSMMLLCLFYAKQIIVLVDCDRAVSVSPAGALCTSMIQLKKNKNEDSMFRMLSAQCCGHNCDFVEVRRTDVCSVQKLRYCGRDSRLL